MNILESATASKLFSTDVSVIWEDDICNVNAKVTSLFASIKRSSHHDVEEVSFFPLTVVLILAAGDLKICTYAESSKCDSLDSILGQAAEISQSVAPLGLLLGEEDRQNLLLEG